jgi:phytanoyl-CoA hydroxylase
MKITLESGPAVAVPRVVAEPQVRSFVENGYLVVPDLMSADEVEELRRDAAKIARGGYPTPSIPPQPEEMTDDNVMRNVLCIHQPHFISPVIQNYVRHPTICGILSQIVAAHLPWWDGSVKCMQSMLFVKPPGFQGQAWHQDEIFIPTRDRSLCGAWIALDDASLESGCLWVLPGSHRAGFLFPQRPHENPEEFDFAPESYGFEETAEVPVEVETGSLVFFNGYLLHRSRKNRGRALRRVLVSHYCNAWSLLPWSLKDGERPANADRRCVVPVSGSDPYAWKGYEPAPDTVWVRPCRASEEAGSGAGG